MEHWLPPRRNMVCFCRWDWQPWRPIQATHKIYIHIYISIKSNNSLNFNQENFVELLKILERNIYSFTYSFIQKKNIYLHILKSTKLKDYTYFNQKIVILSTVVPLKRNICTIIYLFIYRKNPQNCHPLIYQLLKLKK